MRILRRVLRPIKGVRRLPKKIARLASRCWEQGRSIAKKLKIFPLDTLSGKAFAAAEILLIATVLCAAVYGLGGWQDNGTLVRVIDPLLPYLTGSLCLAIGLFAVSYPLDQRGYVRSFLVRTGIRQLWREATRLVAVVVGFIVAVAVSTAVGAGPVARATGIREPVHVEFDISPVVLLGAVTFLLASLIAYWLFMRRKKASLRRDLTILAVEQQDETTKTVSIRNDSDGRVSFTKAKFEDSVGNEYVMDDELSFRPGEKRWVDLPTDFELSKTDYDVPFLLSPLYRDSRRPRMYARSGDTFILEWEDNR